ncbi:MAG: Nucleoside diphosphate-linked moiety motif 17 [Candidatus Parcubacteria bacterium]|jgi:8-oxo-dGTP pyrophosphatase MutT (NUDIX family)
MNPLGTFNVAVAALIEKDEKILITKRSATRDHAPNEWEAGITGRIGQNESMEEALIREVKEEIGLTVEIVTPYRVFHFYRGKEKTEHQGVNFWCKYVGGEVQLDLTEQSEYKWVTPEEALRYINEEDVKKSLEYFLEFKKHYTP